MDVLIDTCTDPMEKKKYELETGNKWKPIHKAMEIFKKSENEGLTDEATGDYEIEKWREVG
jgi:hypothetical protein